MNTLHSRPIAAIRKARRARHTASSELARDLASFDTRSDLTDLAAILDRHSDSDAATVRDLVDWSRAA